MGIGANQGRPVELTRFNWIWSVAEQSLLSDLFRQEIILGLTGTPVEVWSSNEERRQTMVLEDGNLRSFIGNFLSFPS